MQSSVRLLSVTASGILNSEAERDVSQSLCVLRLMFRRAALLRRASPRSVLCSSRLRCASTFSAEKNLRAQQTLRNLKLGVPAIQERLLKGLNNDLLTDSAVRESLIHQGAIKQLLDLRQKENRQQAVHALAEHSKEFQGIVRQSLALLGHNELPLHRKRRGLRVLAFECETRHRSFHVPCLQWWRHSRSDHTGDSSRDAESCRQTGQRSAHCTTGTTDRVKTAARSV